MTSVDEKLLHTILQALIDAEASQHIGADRHQCTDTRRTYRNGTRDKTVSTTSGDLTVKSPRHTHRVLLPLVVDPPGGASTWRCTRW
jgi:putative transposase